MEACLRLKVQRIWGSNGTKSKDLREVRTAGETFSSTASNIYSASKVYYGALLKTAVGIRAKTLRGRVHNEAVRL